jgi:hypothetical protein
MSLFTPRERAQIEAEPMLVGHSFGGMFRQPLAGKGLAKVPVSIDPAPYRGVLPLPLSVLEAAFVEPHAA